MISITKAGTEDIAIIRKLADATWRFSYRNMISPEQIAYMLEMMYSPSSLQNQMNTGHQFLLILDQGAASGFASFSPVENNSSSYRLHKLYVLPGQQGKGLGKKLLDAVISNASDLGASLLELNVNRNNPSLEFYRKQGFAIREEVDLDIGSGFYMNDYIMEKKI